LGTGVPGGGQLGDRERQRRDQRGYPDLVRDGTHSLASHRTRERSPQWKSPVTAVWLQFVVGVVVSLGLGFKYGVLPAFVLIATILTAVIVLITSP
jgi:amino acid transporter